MADGKLVHVEGSANLIGSVTNNVQVNMGGRKSPLPQDVQRVVDRFQQLLDGQKINRAQLLRLVPRDWGWTLAHVSEPLGLLQALTADRIAWLAEYFGLREEWLAGNGDRIFDWPHGYKQPQRFAQILAEMGWLRPGLRMTVLSDGYRTGRNGSLGQFTMVFSLPLVEWDHGEITVYRHLNFDHSPMDWGHPPCRFDALVLGLWFHRYANPGATIPIFACSRVVEVTEGTAFPSPLIPWGYGNLDRLDDRVVPDFGRAVHDLAEVEAYVNRRGLQIIAPVPQKALPDGPS